MEPRARSVMIEIFVENSLNKSFVLVNRFTQYIDKLKISNMLAAVGGPVSEAKILGLKIIS